MQKLKSKNAALVFELYTVCCWEHAEWSELLLKGEGAMWKGSASYGRDLSDGTKLKETCCWWNELTFIEAA